MDELALKKNNILQLKANVALLTTEYAQLEREIADTARGVRELEAGQTAIASPREDRTHSCAQHRDCLLSPAPGWMYILLSFILACVCATASTGFVVVLASDGPGRVLLATALFLIASIAGVLTPCVLIAGKNAGVY